MPNKYCLDDENRRIYLIYKKYISSINNAELEELNRLQNKFGDYQDSICKLKETPYETNIQQEGEINRIPTKDKGQ